jgi:hypothetical protein
MSQPRAIILIGLFIAYTPPKGKLVQRGHPCLRVFQIQAETTQRSNILKSATFKRAYYTLYDFKMTLIKLNLIIRRTLQTGIENVKPFPLK